MVGIIGKKIGMTQLFDDNGNRVAVTVIEAGPCPVTQVKTAENDGYEAVAARRSSDCKDKTSPSRSSAISRRPGSSTASATSPSSAASADLTVGDTVTVEPFEEGQMVSVTGVSKGKGFQGTIKRHNFARGPESHGSHNVRQPGSIGASAYPSRVFKGMRMSGHMGDASGHPARPACRRSRPREQPAPGPRRSPRRPELRRHRQGQVDVAADEHHRTRPASSRPRPRKALSRGRRAEASRRSSRLGQEGVRSRPIRRLPPRAQDGRQAGRRAEATKPAAKAKPRPRSRPPRLKRRSRRQGEGRCREADRRGPAAKPRSRRAKTPHRRPRQPRRGKKPPPRPPSRLRLKKAQAEAGQGCRGRRARSGQPSPLRVGRRSGRPLRGRDRADGRALRRRPPTSTRCTWPCSVEQAARRRGTASSKTRGEIAGSTAKLYRQKGTGRARAGSVKSPVRTGGGVAFGPRPRNFAIKINRKAARKALAMALSDRAESRQHLRDARPRARPRPARRRVDACSWPSTSPRPCSSSREDEPAVAKSVRNLCVRRGRPTRARLTVEQVLRARSLVVHREGVRRPERGADHDRSREDHHPADHLREELPPDRPQPVHVPRCIRTAHKTDDRARRSSELFDVKVVDVSTMNVRPKPKRRGAHRGRTGAWKKAVVAADARRQDRVLRGQVSGHQEIQAHVARPSLHDDRDVRRDHAVHPRAFPCGPDQEDRRAQQQRAYHHASPRRRPQAPLPHHRLQARQRRRARPVAHIEYDPNRSARIALLHYADGEKRYILAPRRLAVGDTVRVRPGGRHQARQRAAAREHPDRHHHPQHRARSGPRRAAGAQRRHAALSCRPRRRGTASFVCLPSELRRITSPVARPSARSATPTTPTSTAARPAAVAGAACVPPCAAPP